MIPTVSSVSGTSQTVQPGQTYAVDFEKGRVTGMISGLDALKQTVFLSLSIERYAWEIYSWDYGAELGGLIGKPKEYVYPEIKRRISEALLRDDRITEVINFEFEGKGHTVTVAFTVVSRLGNLQLETEVTI